MTSIESAAPYFAAAQRPFTAVCAAADRAAAAARRFAEALGAVPLSAADGAAGAPKTEPAGPAGAARFAAPAGGLLAGQWCVEAQCALAGVPDAAGGFAALGAALGAAGAGARDFAGAIGAVAAPLGAAAAAQQLFGASLLACPLGQIGAAVLGVVSLFYAAAGAVGAVTGSAVSGAGLIGAAVAAALGTAGNLFLALWNTGANVFALLYNLVAAVAEFVGTVFTDPIGAVCGLFFALADTVLGVLETLAGALDTIFGSNLSAAVQGWRKTLGAWTQEALGERGAGAGRLDVGDILGKRIDVADLAALGYDLGAGLDAAPAAPEQFAGLAAQGQYVLLLPADEETGQTVRRIAGSTRAIRDAVVPAGEDLRYLRELAEREAIDRFTAAEIKIEQVNHNTIAAPQDIDGVVDRLTRSLSEALNSMAEGVSPA